MANGRAAALEAHDALAGEPFLAIGEIAGRAASARILLAAPLSLDDIEAVAGASIETTDELTFDRASASLRARRRRRLGALVLAEQTLARSARRSGRARPGARRAFPWARSLAVERKASSNGATGSCFCAAPKASRGPIFPTRRWPPNQGGWRRFSSGRRASTRSAADDLSAALGAALPWASRAPPRRRGADPLPRADRDRGADRLRSRGRADDFAARAGAVRAQGASVAGRRAHSAHARAAFARPSADPDHPRPAGLLARLLGRRPRRSSRPLPPPFLARGPRRRRADGAGEAEGDVRGRFKRVKPSRMTVSDQAIWRRGECVVRRGSPVLLNER